MDNQTSMSVTGVLEPHDDTRHGWLIAINPLTSLVYLAASFYHAKKIADRKQVGGQDKYEQSLQSDEHDEQSIMLAAATSKERRGAKEGVKYRV